MEQTLSALVYFTILIIINYQDIHGPISSHTQKKLYELCAIIILISEDRKLEASKIKRLVPGHRTSGRS